MFNCHALFYHIAGNSTSYIIIIFGTIMAFYEIWENYEKIKKNIISTVIYSILFIFGVLQIIDIQIITLCCLKKKVKRYKLISLLKDINETLSDAINELGKDDALKFLEECEMELSLLKNNIKKINGNVISTNNSAKNGKKVRKKKKKKNK